MPTTDDYGQGVSIAALTDKPDAEKLAKEIANGVAARSVMRFADAAARNATLTSPVDGMMAWLDAEQSMTVRASGSWRTVATDRARTTTTTGLTLRSGWSLSAFQASAVCGVAMVRVDVQRTGGTIPASAAGNLADTEVCVLPAGWRPFDTRTAVVEDGFGSGAARVTTDGVITLRTWSSNGEITSGNVTRITDTFIVG